MHILIILLIIIIVILCPALIGITLAALGVITYLLIEAAIPLLMCTTLLVALHFIGRKNKSVLVTRLRYFLSLLIMVSLSIIFWVSEAYFASYLVFMVSNIYLLMNNEMQGAENKIDKPDLFIRKASIIAFIAFYSHALTFPFMGTGLIDMSMFTFSMVFAPLVTISVFALREKDNRKIIISHFKSNKFNILIYGIAVIAGILLNAIYIDKFHTIQIFLQSHRI